MVEQHEHGTDVARDNGSTEMDEESIADVEVNADSRFIDFSLATPWEHLVADLEKAIKSWTKQKGKIMIKANVF